MIPDDAADFLNQAIDCKHAPSGAIVLAASAVDAMLKSKEYKDGTLATRISSAATAGLITKDMQTWANEVRLDSNAERHADASIPKPTRDDAERAIEFCLALAEYLFVLPHRVEEGRRRRDKDTDA